LKLLQDGDTQIAEYQYELWGRTSAARANKDLRTIHWCVDGCGLLCCNNAVVVPPDPAVRAELMKIYYDDLYAGHFTAKQTEELLSWNYY
jgi:hypothetical protein